MKPTESMHHKARKQQTNETEKQIALNKQVQT